MDNKIKALTTAALLTVLAGCSTAPVLTADAPVVYLNSNIGVNLDDYKYTQPEMICQVDEEMVEHITLRAAKENIRVVPVYTYMEMEEASNVLAIDVTDLPDETQTVHAGSKSVNPKLGITAAFIDKTPKTPLTLSFKEHCTAKVDHGGSTTTAAGDTFGGGAGFSVCKEMRRCARRVSAGVADWLAEEVKI